MLSIARMTPLPGGSELPFGGHVIPWGLHHETDTRPYRARTVIVYLSTVQNGGHTVFPLCGSRSDVPQVSDLQTALAKGLHSQFGGEERRFGR